MASAEVLQLQERWALDDRCIDYLSSLPEQLQQQVSAEFQHTDGQTNPSARCMAFAKKLNDIHRGTAEGGPDLTSELESFISNFGLDERCLSYLSGLPPHVLSVVLHQFEHSPGQTNPSARCMSFAKQVLQNQGQRPMQTIQLDPASVFQQRWGVDDRCMGLLLSCTPDVQAVVMEKFDHKPGQTNVSARCSAFIKSVARGPPQDPLTLFQQRWGIDDRCVEFLSTLPAHVQSVVLQQFDHKPGQTNVSARCQSFTNSILRNQQGGGFQAEQQAAPVFRSGAVQETPPWRDQAMFSMPPAPQAAWNAGQASFDSIGGGDEDQAGGEDIPTFQLRWGIDDHCAQFLSTLPAEVQAIVVDKFEQRPDQTNPSKRCMAFAKSLLQAHQQKEANDPLADFQARWELDDKCITYLAQLPQEVQNIVVAEFDHQPHQTNASARCQAFARAVMTRDQHQPQQFQQPQQQQFFSPQFQQHQHVQQFAQPQFAQQVARNRLPFPPQPHRPVQHYVIGSSGPAPLQSPRAWQAANQHQPQPQFQHQVVGVKRPWIDMSQSHGQLQQFKAQWGLDDRAIDHLSSLPEHVQQIVMEKFDHRPDQTNVSARCCAFAKSVAGGQHGGGQQGFVQMDPMAQFQARWGLDEKCLSYLGSLSPEVQQTVMAQFDHQPHQTNPSARCMAFAKSMLRG